MLMNQRLVAKFMFKLMVIRTQIILQCEDMTLVLNSTQKLDHEDGTAQDNKRRPQLISSTNMDFILPPRLDNSK